MAKSYSCIAYIACLRLSWNLAYSIYLNGYNYLVRYSLVLFQKGHTLCNRITRSVSIRYNLRVSYIYSRTDWIRCNKPSIKNRALEWNKMCLDTELGKLNFRRLISRFVDPKWRQNIANFRPGNGLIPPTFVGTTVFCILHMTYHIKLFIWW